MPAEPVQPQDLSHIPVMLNEVIEYLEPGLGQTFVDGTLGLGGHAHPVPWPRLRQGRRAEQA